MDESEYLENTILENAIEETKEELETFNNQLLILEKEPENKDAINEIFRMAHNLKGLAYTMGYKRKHRLTRDIESIFGEVREGRMKVNPELLDILFQCLEALKEHLSCVIETSNEGTNENEPIIARLDDILLKQGISNESR